jgi:hypothetical protein
MAKTARKLMSELTAAEIVNPDIRPLDRDYACFVLGKMDALGIPLPDSFSVTDDGHIHFSWPIGGTDTVSFRVNEKAYWCVFKGGEKDRGWGLPELRDKFKELAAPAAEAVPA